MLRQPCSCGGDGDRRLRAGERVWALLDCVAHQHGFLRDGPGMLPARPVRRVCAWKARDQRVPTTRSCRAARDERGGRVAVGGSNGCVAFRRARRLDRVPGLVGRLLDTAASRAFGSAHTDPLAARPHRLSSPNSKGCAPVTLSHTVGSLRHCIFHTCGGDTTSIEAHDVHPASPIPLEVNVEQWFTVVGLRFTRRDSSWYGSRRSMGLDPLEHSRLPRAFVLTREGVEGSGESRATGAPFLYAMLAFPTTIPLVRVPSSTPHCVTTVPICTTSNALPGTRLSAARFSSLQRESGAPLTYQELPLSARNIP
jgi:hypothetical protein